jgi:hypothetical protein
MMRPLPSLYSIVSAARRMSLRSMTEAPPARPTSCSRWAVSTISRSVRSGEIRDTAFGMLM